MLEFLDLFVILDQWWNLLLPELSCQSRLPVYSAEGPSVCPGAFQWTLGDRYAWTTAPASDMPRTKIGTFCKRNTPNIFYIKHKNLQFYESQGTSLLSIYHLWAFLSFSQTTLVHFPAYNIIYTELYTPTQLGTTMACPETPLPPPSHFPMDDRHEMA